MNIIEKNVPAPKSKSSGGGAPRKYPFADMAVGDSVFFAGENSSSKIYIAAIQYGRYKNWKFSGRTENEGLRIWRIK